MGSDTFVDFDHGLNSAINKIREALNDSASAPRFVETVAGKGYRFIGSVAVDGAAAEPTPPRSPGLADDELPSAPRRTVRVLLLLIQAMYLAFYVGALANLQEIHEIFVESGLPVSVMMAALITSSAVLIPVRLYLASAVAMDFPGLKAKFGTMFPVLIVLDLMWAVSPFLLIHHISAGLALGLSAPLVYVPFAQRSLVWMYSRVDQR
jgi:hypothetical protein